VKALSIGYPNLSWLQYWVLLPYAYDFETSYLYAAPDLDGGEPGAQAWWEAPCADRIYNL